MLKLIYISHILYIRITDNKIRSYLSPSIKIKEPSLYLEMAPCYKYFMSVDSKLSQTVQLQFRTSIY